jgi:hypothetical protein
MVIDRVARTGIVALGKGVLAKVFKFQMRPDPLAH